MLEAKAPNYDTCGSQGLTPTYEQAHVCADLLTLVSYKCINIFDFD